MNLTKKVFICLMLVMTFALSIDANKPQPQEVNINFNNLQINDFIKLVSNVLHKNILLRTPIPGKVDFISTTPVYKKDLLTILQSVLGSNGYSLVDRDSFLEVVRSKEASQYNLPIVKNVGSSYLQMVTKMVSLNHVNVDLILPKVKNLLSSSGSMSSVRDVNSIIITDFPKNIATIEKVIKTIERNENMRTRFYKLKNAEVGYIAPALMSIINSRFSSKVSTNKVTIAIDKAGNSIVAVGTVKNLNTLSQIIAQFDKKGSLPLKQTAIISLKNTEVKDVLSVITKIIAAHKKTNPLGATTVVSEPNTNSIVVSGVREEIDEIRSIVHELDKEQQQVYVKARVIEVSKSATEELGAKFGIQAGKANSSGLYTMAMNMGGSSVSLSGTLLSKISMPELRSGLALGATIDFLTTNGAANVVAEPSILCINNKESKIYVGQTESIITSATTTSNTTDLSRNTYSREDIGLTLKIKPRISNDGKVTLEAETIIEDVVPNSQVGMPTTTKREVTTKAIVKNGESVIVGGLIRDKSSKSTSKVPLLGDIPLLGELFKHHDDKGESLNIVIILTPYIITTSENLTSLRENLVELDNLQDRYNKRFMKKLRDQNKRAVEQKFPKKEQKYENMLEKFYEKKSKR